MATSTAEINDPFWENDVELLVDILQNLEDPDREITVPTWEEAAMSDQQRFYYFLGDRLFDSYKIEDSIYLEVKVGYALYGPPGNIEGNDLAIIDKCAENSLIGYSPEQVEEIKKVVAFIKESQPEGYEVLFGVVFIVIYMEDYPLLPKAVFRVPKANTEEKITSELSYSYIDSHCRLYSSWNNFLEENLLPKCQFCYPLNGIYERNCSKDGDQVLVGFRESPACSWTNETLSRLDTVSMGASIGLTVVGLASLASVPVAAPIVAAAAYSGVLTGLYGAARSAGNLRDRAVHSQPIDPTNPEARNSWITLGSTIALASTQVTGLLSRIAQRGGTVGSATLLAADALNVSALIISGLGIANGAWILYNRYHFADLTTLELFQFTSSVLFFTNSVMNLQTARTIIQDVQRDTLRDHRASLRSNRHRRAFDKMAKNTRRGFNQMDGNAKVIKGIRRINNKDDFYAGVVRTSKQVAKSGSKATFTENGNVNIDSNFEVHPMDFSKIPKQDRQVILDASKKINGGKITNEQFHKTVQKVYAKNNMIFNTATSNDIKNVFSAFGTISLDDVVICGKNIFSEITNTEYKQLTTLLTNENFQHVFKFASEIASKMNCKTAAEFLNFMEFACPYFSVIYDELKNAYNIIKNVARYTDRDFSNEKFTSDFSSDFLKLLKSIYNCAQKINELKEDYLQHRAKQQSYRNTQSPETSSQGSETTNNSKSGLFHVASELAVELAYVKREEFFDFMEFVCPYLEREYDQLESTYQGWVALMKNARLTNNELAKIYGIKGERSLYFIKVIEDKYTDEVRKQELRIAYQEFKLHSKH